MRRIFVLLSLVSSLFFSITANAADVFTITDVSISGNGTNSREAKDNAINAGEVKAFQKLLARITPDASGSTWPQVGADKISDLVQEMGVDKEKITSTHYEAVLDITFNDDMVKKLLQEAGVSYTTDRLEPTLLLPIQIKDGEGVLWDGSNFWKNAWDDPVKKSSFANFIIPTGDLVDVSSVNVKSLVENESPLNADDAAKLRSLMRKYGAKKLVVAKEITSQSDGTITVEVELSRVLEDNPQRATSKFYGKADEQTEQDVMQKAAAKIIDNVERKWKDRQEAMREDKKEMNVNIPVKDLAEWNDIRKKLAEFDFIDKSVTKYITVEFVSVDLYFQNGYEDFVQKLASKGMYLEKRENGLFMRRQADRPGWFEPSSYEGYIDEQNLQDNSGAPQYKNGYEVHNDDQR